MPRRKGTFSRGLFRALNVPQAGVLSAVQGVTDLAQGDLKGAGRNFKESGKVASIFPPVAAVIAGVNATGGRKIELSDFIPNERYAEDTGLGKAAIRNTPGGSMGQGITRLLLNIGTDPVTYVGGGFLPAGKAGLVGGKLSRQAAKRQAIARKADKKARQRAKPHGESVTAGEMASLQGQVETALQMSGKEFRFNWLGNWKAPTAKVGPMRTAQTYEKSAVRQLDPTIDLERTTFARGHGSNRAVGEVGAVAKRHTNTKTAQFERTALDLDAKVRARNKAFNKKRGKNKPKRKLEEAYRQISTKVDDPGAKIADDLADLADDYKAAYTDLRSWETSLGMAATNIDGAYFPHFTKHVRGWRRGQLHNRAAPKTRDSDPLKLLQRKSVKTTSGQKRSNESLPAFAARIRKESDGAQDAVWNPTEALLARINDGKMAGADRILSQGVASSRGIRVDTGKLKQQLKDLRMLRHRFAAQQNADELAEGKNVPGLNYDEVVANPGASKSPVDVDMGRLPGERYLPGRGQAQRSRFETTQPKIKTGGRKNPAEPQSPGYRQVEAGRGKNDPNQMFDGMLDSRPVELPKGMKTVEDMDDKIAQIEETLGLVARQDDEIFMGKGAMKELRAKMSDEELDAVSALYGVGEGLAKDEARDAAAAFLIGANRYKSVDSIADVSVAFANKLTAAETANWLALSKVPKVELMTDEFFTTFNQHWSKFADDLYEEGFFQYAGVATKHSKFGGELPGTVDELADAAVGKTAAQVRTGKTETRVMGETAERVDDATSMLRMRLSIDRAFTRPQDIADFNGVMQRFVSRWKALALLSPAYHARNAVDDGFRLWIGSSKNPVSLYKSIKESTRLYATYYSRGAIPGVNRVGRRTLKKMAYKDENRVFMTLPDGEKLTVRDMINMIDGEGIWGSGQVGADIGQVTQTSIKSGFGRNTGKGKFVQASARFGQGREETMRVTLYLDRLKHGDTTADAARMVRDAMFDYGDVSRFVESARRFWLPFVTYTSKSIPYWTKLSARKPVVPVTLNKMREESNLQATGVKNPNVPGYSPMSFYLPITDKILGGKGDPIMIDPSNSFGLVGVTDQARAVMELGGSITSPSGYKEANLTPLTSLLGPVPSAAAGLAGFDLFRGRGYYPGETKQRGIPGWLSGNVNPQLAAMLGMLPAENQIPRALAGPAKATGRGGAGPNDWASTIRYLTGAPVSGETAETILGDHYEEPEDEEED